MSGNILRLEQVKQKCGLSRSCIYKLMSKGLFPSSVLLGLRAVGWVESDIQQWIITRRQTSKLSLS